MFIGFTVEKMDGDREPTVAFRTMKSCFFFLGELGWKEILYYEREYHPKKKKKKLKNSAQVNKYGRRKEVFNVLLWFWC